MAERKLVSKVLTLEMYRRDPATRKAVRAGVRLRGWEAVDEYLKGQGTALIRETTPEGIASIRMPEGWDSMVVEMENIYDDGTSEKW